MAKEYRDLTCEQRSEMFDDIQTMLKDGEPLDKIKFKIMAKYNIADVWSSKSRWDLPNLEKFIQRVKEWSETEIIRGETF
jgi:hypothetical protein